MNGTTAPNSAAPRELRNSGIPARVLTRSAALHSKRRQACPPLVGMPALLRFHDDVVFVGVLVMDATIVVHVWPNTVENVPISV